MIEHVWRRCCQAVDAEQVIIATDDERIEAAARRFGARVEMTSSECLTGTDRVAEVADRYPADWYVNVQGDEPLVDPNAINALIASMTKAPENLSAINAMSEIADENDFRSATVPKVVTDQNDRLLYISRAPIPSNKDGVFQSALRQVGLYAFRSSALCLYSNQTKSRLESLEDIEILRLVEAGLHVRMVRVPNPGPAVDSPEDLQRALRLIHALRSDGSSTHQEHF